MQLLLRQGQNPDGRLWLAQVVVDTDQCLYCSLWAALVLMLFVVQRLGKGMALLRQSTQSSAHSLHTISAFVCQDICFAQRKSMLRSTTAPNHND